MSAREKIEKLRQEIRHHDHKYYVEASPEITDRQYDRMMAELRELEAANPQLITPDSPSQRIGDSPVDHLPSVEHRVPMLSIDNTYSTDELRTYGDRIAKLIAGETIQWVIELKIDGVAATLIYEDGILVRGITRGDGHTGDDVTHNIRTVTDVPLRLHGDNPPSVLEVRGEVYMTNSELVRLNEFQESHGMQPFANTRNVTAGSIRMLDPRICAQRHLRMFCHGVGYAEGLRSDNHVDFLQELESYGLSPTPFVESFDSLEQAIAHSELLIERLHELDFEVDGLVFKVNQFDQRSKLGSTTKSPRWLIAYKFEKYEATTKLAAIHVQVGKTGTITPVAELEPVVLAGTTVSRASLHNADEIERKGIRVGDVVVVEKAGKIIPHIVRVEKHLRQEGAEPFHFPTTCPECQTKLQRDEGGVYIRCPNPFCPAQLKERIRYFAGRNAMDIEGLGDKLVDQLVETGLIRNFGDLYRLRLEDVVALDRMGPKSARNLLDGIQQSKTRGLERVLNALSIRHVGTNVARVIARRFGNIESLQRASLSELSAINEIGPVIAQSMFDFLRSDAGIETLAQLKDAGVSLVADTSEEPTSDSRFAGKSFVVTGTLQNYTRDEIHSLIQKYGGRAASSVSQKTDYVVAGEKAGSKLDQARRLGIRVLSEQQFEALLP